MVSALMHLLVVELGLTLGLLVYSGVDIANKVITAEYMATTTVRNSESYTLKADVVNYLDNIRNDGDNDNDVAMVAQRLGNETTEWALSEIAQCVRKNFKLDDIMQGCPVSVANLNLNDTLDGVPRRVATARAFEGKVIATQIVGCVLTFGSVLLILIHWFLHCKALDFRSGRYLVWHYRMTRSKQFWWINLGLLCGYFIAAFVLTIVSFVGNDGMDATALLQLIGPMFAVVMVNFMKLLTPPDVGPIIDDTMRAVKFYRPLSKAFEQNTPFLMRVNVAVLQHVHGTPFELNDIAESNAYRKTWLDDVQHKQSLKESKKAPKKTAKVKPATKAEAEPTAEPTDKKAEA